MLHIRASAELFVKIEGCVSLLTQLEMILDTSFWVYTFSKLNLGRRLNAIFLDPSS
jgi:hypothetical protein